MKKISLLTAFIISISLLNFSSAFAQCNAAFSHYNGVNPDSIHFYPTGTSAISYAWDFGDGDTSTNQYPWHFYLQAGTYYVCLTITTSTDTCTSCDSVIVNIPPPCNAEFQYSPASNPDSIHFYPNSTSAVSYHWNFGDGNTSTSATPLHFYSSPGNYYVCLTVFTTTDTCSWCDSVTVNPPPPCNAEFAYYSISNPDSLHFYPLETGGLSYYWSFGDGNTSTSQYPWHLYAGPGIYNVCLYVITATDTCSWCDSVMVNPPPPCNAEFSYYAGANPDSVHFYPYTTGAVAYHWTFGDGSFSSAISPWHFFTNPGNYYVCLTIITSTDTCDWCDSVTVNPPPPCNAEFGHYSGTNPDSLHFYPLGTSATSYFWSFGDGSTSTDHYPWHYYAFPGTYFVCLTITTANDTCDWCDSIVVNPTAPCNAEFSGYAGSNPDSVHFYPHSTAGNSYFWDFGDGSTSSATTPWHYFPTPGSYYVCLTIITSTDTCTWCDSVTVNPPPPCNAEFAYYSISNPDSVHFYPLGSGAISYNWSFGDGGTSTSQYPWHLYPSPGTYYVCLYVITATDTCSWCDSVTVNAPPPCNAEFSDYAGVNPDSIHFYPHNTSASSYLWNFGDGSTSTAIAPWHFYSASGNYFVCLTVIDSGDTCTWCDSVIVNPPVPCNAEFSDYAGSNPDSVHFYPHTTAGHSYFWDFGDGSTSSAITPWHYFTTPGSYYVCLTVITSTDTCTWCDSVIVNSPPPCNAEFAYYSISNPDSVHFYPLGTGGTSYYWSFGDGNTSTSHYPWHLYPGPGTYYVCLYVITTTDTCSWCDSVTVNAPPPCNAEFSDYAGINPDSIHFYPHSTSASSYLWNFGDGSTSTSIAPWHFYSAAGNYFVCLTVIDSGDTCTWCDSVTVNSPAPCNAEFAHYSISNPDSVHFYPIGSTATSYYWTFGDGSTSSGQYPWHYYSGPGTYYVCLTITTLADTCTWCDSVVVNPPAPCNAEFQYYAGANPDSLHFYPNTTSAISYYWSFGDGSTSTNIDPWHQYAADGTYNVCLVITTSSGNCDWCDSVVVSGGHMLNAQFMYFRYGNSDSVQFIAPMNPPAVQYYWEFGDATSSYVQSPLHVFPGAETYFVCLEVTDSSGFVTWCDSVPLQSPTGISSDWLTGAAVLCYPNPADEQVTFIFHDMQEPIALSLFDVSGKLIVELKNISEGPVVLDTKGIPEGIFYYFIANEKGVVAKGKLLIAH